MSAESPRGATTRRALLGGALAAPVAARAAAAAPAKPLAKREVILRGRDIAASPDGKTLVVAHDRKRTIAIHRGRAKPKIVDVKGQPLAVAIAQDGRTAAVSTGFWDKPGVTIVDLATGTIRARRKLGPAPGALAFSPQGGWLVVVGGEQEGTLHVLETERWRIVRSVRLGRCPRDVAVTPGDTHAWVAVAADDRAVLVDLKSGRVERALERLPLADRLALSPQGKRLLVSHAYDDHVTEVDLRTGRRTRHAAGRTPCAVGWAGPHRLVVLGGENAVLRLGGRRRRVDAAPRGLAIAGRRFWTVSNTTGAIEGGRP